MRRPQRQRRVSDATFPAPTRGWWKSVNVTQAPADAAEVLDNFFPTSQGCRLRGGTTVYANIGSGIVQLFAYTSGGGDLFASTASGIYDCDRIAGGGAAFADITGLTNGNWSATSVSTTGGDFTVIVNGEDPLHYYDGTNWNPVFTQAISDVPYDALTGAFTVGDTVTGGTSGATGVIQSIIQTSATAGILKVGTIAGGPFQDNEALTDGSTGAATANGASAAASSITITGKDTSTLTHVWPFKGYLFFLDDSMSAWYLPNGQIGGAMTELPLGGVFRRGGKILIGATWSLDSGEGLDDLCVFITDQGEVAIYQGTDPSSASTWSLEGLYRIGRPVNKHCSFKAGGDLAVVTYDGIVSVGAALNKDRAALEGAAISFPIEAAWKEALEDTAHPVNATLWQSEGLLLVGVEKDVEDNFQAFVANAVTNAWCRYTGWDVQCSVESNDDLYFGTAAGKVMLAETGGQDDADPFTATYVPKFQEGGSASFKVANHAGLTFRASGVPVFSLTGHGDYQIGNLPTPTTTGESSGQSTWGTGTWGTFVWGSSGDTQTYTKWRTIRAQGYSIAPAVRVTSFRTGKAIFEILATRVRYEEGAVL